MVLVHCALAVFPKTKRSFHSASVALMLGTLGIPWPYLAMQEGECDGPVSESDQDQIKWRFDDVKTKL